MITEIGSNVGKWSWSQAQAQRNLDLNAQLPLTSFVAFDTLYTYIKWV